MAARSSHHTAELADLDAMIADAEAESANLGIRGADSPPTTSLAQLASARGDFDDTAGDGMGDAIELDDGGAVPVARALLPRADVQPVTRPAGSAIPRPRVDNGHREPFPDKSIAEPAMSDHGSVTGASSIASLPANGAADYERMRRALREAQKRMRRLVSESKKEHLAAQRRVQAAEAQRDEARAQLTASGGSGSANSSSSSSRQMLTEALMRADKESSARVMAEMEVKELQSEVQELQAAIAKLQAAIAKLQAAPVTVDPELQAAYIAVKARCGRLETAGRIAAEALQQSETAAATADETAQVALGRQQTAETRVIELEKEVQVLQSSLSAANARVKDVQSRAGAGEGQLEEAKQLWQQVITDMRHELEATAAAREEQAELAAQAQAEAARTRVALREAEARASIAEAQLKTQPVTGESASRTASPQLADLDVTMRQDSDAESVISAVLSDRNGGNTSPKSQLARATTSGGSSGNGLLRRMSFRAASKGKLVRSPTASATVKTVATAINAVNTFAGKMSPTGSIPSTSVSSTAASSPANGHAFPTATVEASSPSSSSLPSATVEASSSSSLPSATVEASSSSSSGLPSVPVSLVLAEPPIARPPSSHVKATARPRRAAPRLRKPPPRPHTATDSEFSPASSQARQIPSSASAAHMSSAMIQSPVAVPSAPAPIMPLLQAIQADSPNAPHLPEALRTLAGLSARSHHASHALNMTSPSAYAQHGDDAFTQRAMTPARTHVPITAAPPPPVFASRRTSPQAQRQHRSPPHQQDPQAAAEELAALRDRVLRRSAELRAAGAGRPSHGV